MFHDFIKDQRRSLPGGLKRGGSTAKKHENYSDRVPEGSKQKGKSNNDDTHGHGQEKKETHNIKLKEEKWNLSTSFYDCIQKQTNPYLCALKRESATKKHENYNGRFPEGSSKRKSNNGDKHGHGQEKRRHATLS